MKRRQEEIRDPHGDGGKLKLEQEDCSGLCSFQLSAISAVHLKIIILRLPARPGMNNTLKRFPLSLC